MGRDTLPCYSCGPPLPDDQPYYCPRDRAFDPPDTVFGGLRRPETCPGGTCHVGRDVARETVRVS